MTASERELNELTASLGGRYRVERQLGRGGMGAVYLARDVQLDRSVAVKVLPHDVADDVTLRERFVRETRMAASFSHPNIVPVHAVEERDGVLAFIMGFVEGESLAQRVARGGALTPRECVRLLQDVAFALAYAHGRGVVHRDIKPDNVMLERATGRALLMDFGVSRSVSTTPANPAMTRVGEVVGTPEFMSPEQAAGEELDGRSDLYSLGLTAYFALLGKPAYSGDSAQRLLVRQLTEVIPPLSSLRTDLPPTLGAIIDRLLSKDRDARFADAQGLLEALEAANAGGPEVPVPIRVFAQEASTLGLVIVFVALFIWVFIWFVASRTDSFDPFLPLIVLVAVLWSRIAQTFSEARRLIAQGFSVADIQRGIQATLDEREERRAQLRNDPLVHRARRRTLTAATLMLVTAPLLFWFALESRHQVGPTRYEVTLPGAICLFTSLINVGFALPLLMRSPFRSSIGERLFHRVWAGLPGRLFLRLAARRAHRGGATVSPSGSNPTTAPHALPRARTQVQVAPPATLTALPSDAEKRLAELESRLARLEKAVTRAG